jgi:membrane protein implicated in regulation of membrane protease activity
MSGLETVFLICAVAGGVLFLFRLVMQFLGAGLDAGGDLPSDIPHDIPQDVPHDIHAHTGAASSEASFKLITIQGIMAFLMMFGLVGFAFEKTMPGNDPKAIVAAVAVGVAVMFLQAKLMQFLLRLQSSGTINLDNALGQEGTVYLTIPADGIGKVEVLVQNRLKIFDACSAEKTAIPTGEPVRVVEVTEGNVLVVERVSAKS